MLYVTDDEKRLARFRRQARWSAVLLAGAGAILLALNACGTFAPAEGGQYRFELEELPAWIDPLAEAITLRATTLAEFEAAMVAAAATEADTLRVRLMAEALRPWSRGGDYRGAGERRVLLRAIETAHPESFSSAQRSALATAAVAFAQGVIVEERDAEVARLNALLAPVAVPGDLGEPVTGGGE